jgi:hypothetical protein
MHLQGLKKLQQLVLSDTRITDAGMKYLKDFTALTDLQLDSTQITDQGIAHLKVLTQLTHLQLIGNPVTDAGVAELQDRALTLHELTAANRLAGAASEGEDGGCVLKTLRPGEAS